MPTLPSAGRPCAVAILAGGRAARLDGADKGALVVGGRSILERQLDALAGLADDVFLVGGPRRTAGPAARLPHVTDLEPARGPLGGIQAALHHAGAAVDALLIVACDLPFLSKPFLAYLVARATQPGAAGPAAADVVVPRTAHGLHPLCAAYNRRVRDAVDRRVASGALAVHALFDEVRVDVVGPEVVATFDPDGVMLWNVNTPEEYERACARAVMA